MNMKNNQAVKPEEKQLTHASIDKSRRSFAKTGFVAPVIMSLGSKTALGSVYQCTISGMQSGNQSSHPGTYNCGVGISPGGWKQNAEKCGNSDGNINQWILAGVNPFSITTKIERTEVTYTCELRSGKYNVTPVTKIYIDSVLISTEEGNTRRNQDSCPAPTTSSVTKKYIIQNGQYQENSCVYDAIKAAFGVNAQATTFASIFGGSGSSTLWEVLYNNPGSLEFHAIADYLNAGLNKATGQFNPVYDGITPQYIVKVYNDPSLTSAQKKAYFELLHH